MADFRGDGDGRVRFEGWLSYAEGWLIDDREEVARLSGRGVAGGPMDPLP